ncbi:MAG: recombinase family protein [Pseudonocardiales bacterium]|nr:recombinase family protein [Pseudonocardiales bacterium]
MDAEQAAVVREIAERLLVGVSAAEIAADLNARDVPAPAGTVWRPSNITRLIKAPALAGLRVYRGEVLDEVRTTWEPILTVDDHRRLVALLTDPTRRSSRTGAHIRHLLPGVAECGVCGGPVRTITRKRARDRVVVYNCRARYCFSRIAAEVDDLVGQVMIGYLSRPDVAAELAAGDPVAEGAAEVVARLRAKLEEARRLVAEDRLSLASLVDVERRILPQINAAESAADPTSVEIIWRA